MLEEYLIECCSPTLASIKTANMFNFPFSSDKELYRQIDCWNKIIGSKGVSLTVLRKRENTALIYVYRRARLQADLEKSGVRSFLGECGYGRKDVDGALNKLKARLENDDEFPHEIGVFLGYPLEDVIGFIRNGGKNCKCTGCWKVYCNECEAVKTFDRFKKCSSAYAQLWSRGKSVWQLTVAA